MKNQNYILLAPRALLVSLLFLVLFVNISCKKKNPLEKEPNNTFFNSNRLELDTTVEGFFDTDNDNDFYIINIVSPTILDIELSPVKGVNHAFKFWKQDAKTQKMIKYVDDARKSSSERMCNLFADIGVYYIAVMHGDRDTPRANTENRYKLNVTVRVWESEEIEPNDSLEDANKIETGMDIYGYFSPAFNKLNKKSSPHFREEDWFYFDVPEIGEDPLVVDIKLSDVPEANSAIILLDSEHKEISSSDLGGLGEGEALLDIGIRDTGRYYVLVYSNFETNYNMPYTLLVDSRVHDNSFEIEPNNVHEKYNRIVGNGIKGRIFPSGDIDYFQYTGESDETPVLYRITAESLGDFDIIMKIFNSNEKKLFEIDNGGAGKREIIHAKLPDTFLIEIKARHNETSDLLYNLSIVPLSDSEGYESEPNDSKEIATEVRGNRITGFINKKRDIDYYSLRYDKRVKKSFILHGTKDSKIKISIADSLGYIIKSETVIGNESKSFSEMIDLKGYIIVQIIEENFEEPYIIEIGD